MLLILFSLSGHSQTISDLIFSGDELFLEGDYYAASNYYRKAIQIDSSRLKVVSKYAESCRLFYNYEESAKWYDYLIKYDDKNKFPEARYWLGMMYKSIGDFQQAINQFNLYLQENRNEKGILFNRATAELEACHWAMNAVKDSIPVSIDHPGKPVNTDYSDFGAIQMGDSLLFFSSLQPEDDLPLESLQSGTYLTKIYQSRLTPAGPSVPQELPAKINEPGVHTANVCFTRDHQTYFFTRCEEERRPDLKCAIYMARFKNGRWQRAVKLEKNINQPGYTATHPCIAHTEKEDILYFVSDRPGGFGGNDIWYAVVKKTKIFDPANLGSQINTPGNEITPFYDNKTAILFFSSDWHKGFGGYDIFKSTGAYNQWKQPLNIGYPLNTSFNDMYFTVNETDSNGYLTSNRPGSFFIKNQTCCNDIFSYSYNQPKPESVLKNELPWISATTNETAIRKMLPLTLYFHNDEPDPSTTKESTDRNYRTTVAEYYILLEKYKTEYSKGLKEKAKIQARADIVSFFNDQVLFGLKQLEEFTALLLMDLQAGKEITITIKGFTSPLNSAEYNKSLAKRRIVSLINYFREYKDGIFIPYLSQPAANQGSLTFREEAVGEELASKLVSDNPQDKRNSVYSRAAAMERRIQILYYEGK